MLAKEGKPKEKTPPKEPAKSCWNVTTTGA